MHPAEVYEMGALTFVLALCEVTFHDDGSMIVSIGRPLRSNRDILSALSHYCLNCLEVHKMGALTFTSAFSGVTLHNIISSVARLGSPSRSKKDILLALQHCCMHGLQVLEMGALTSTSALCGVTVHDDGSKIARRGQGATSVSLAVLLPASPGSS